MDDCREQPVDELLVMDCQDGSRKAMELLISRWQKRLWRYALRLTGNSEAAWDVTQESWLAVVRGISQLNDPAHFGPWVYRIVTNKADDWIRKRPKMALLPADFDREARQADGPQAIVTACDLNGVLHRLSHTARTVLALYYLEGLALDDVAAILHVPQGTVKSRLHAARNELKALWGDTPE